MNGVHLSIRGSLNVISIIILSGIFSKRRNQLIELIIIILVATSPLNNPYFHISYIDVGQGNATLIRNPFNGKCVLIDTGSSFNYSKLKSYLYSESIYVIDKLIITHNDTDHNGNIDNLSEDFKVLEIITDGTDIDLDKIKLRYYFVDEYDNDNDNSLIYTLEADGYRFLFTGDISSKVERDFINKYAPFKCDFFLASHHGSNTGNNEYFVSYIMPRYTIISTSGMYNHPSIETINTLESYKVKYYTTKEYGTIRIDLSRYLDLLTLYKGGFVIIMKK